MLSIFDLMKKLSFFLILLQYVSCQSISKKNNMNQLKISKEIFGKTKENTTIHKFILTNKNGMEVSVINFGGIITSLKSRDSKGNYEDVVLGFDNLSQYEDESPYFGAIIGRYGNRIAEGKFTLDGKSYNLAVNNDINHLHGGLKGFDKVVWDPSQEVTDSMVSLILKYKSEDMEEGYPGNLKVKVTYSLDNNDELSVRYEAETDKKTIINLTQHSYFNLSGDFSKDILDHEVTIEADSFLPVGSTLIPTGEIRSVKGTPFDFRYSKTIGEDINISNKQLSYGNGYDHCWVLNNQDIGLRTVASAYHPKSGRLVEVYSDQPGIQFYSGNFLDGKLKSKQDGSYGFRSGLCLETQHYPNSPNEKNFPSVTLNPGEKYRTQTVFKFGYK
jgi:aldose 1-epimerase